MFLRPMRLLVAIFACALMLFSSAFPAYAAAKSDPRQGEAQLKTIESKSLDVLEAGGPYDLEKTASEANKGLNEVQGDADADRMQRPSNSRGANPSVEQVIKSNLEKLQNKTGEADSAK